MNLGLGCLSELKAYLLHDALRTGTDYDTPIAQLGRGVAAQLAAHCRRQWSRTEDDTHVCRADRSSVVLPRYPLEEITKIELRDSFGGTWTELVLGDSLEGMDEGAGLVYIAGELGTRRQQLRFTFTGGYWWPDLDEDEDSTDMETTAHERPSDLLMAWLQQCARAWSVHDTLGVAVAGTQQLTNTNMTLAALELLPVVRDIADRYRNLSLL